MNSSIPLHSPEAERARLLTRLLDGPQSILGSYATKFIFPDIVMSGWIRKHNLVMEVEYVLDRSSIMNERRHAFYNFRMITDDEL